MPHYEIPEADMLRHVTIQKMQYLNTHTTGITNIFTCHCIGYILAGSVKILLPGRELSAGVGDLMYISQESQYYSIWSGEPEISFYSVNFEFSSRRTHAGLGLQIVHDFPGGDFERMWQNRGHPLRVLGAFASILDALYDSRLKTPHTIAGPVISAVRYIEDHCREILSISTLASLCGMSASHFHAVFLREVGTTPVKYRHAMLVQEAIRLLLETDYSIETISDMLGFSSACYFRRIFSAITGKSPREIRQ